MKVKFILFSALFLLAQSAGFCQSFSIAPTNKTVKTKSNSITKPHEATASAKQINILANAQNGYVPGETYNLYFTFIIANTDFEYVDSLSMTFPSGMTLNSVSNDDFFGVAYDDGGDPEAFNGINGQTVSWGDNDNDYGGITSQGSVYSFSANVSFDGGLSGDQIIEVFASGDMFGETPGDQTLSITVSEQEMIESRIQIIHNSADPAAASVDIRVNGDLADPNLDDLAFRTATPFLTVPALSDLIVTVNPPESNDDSGALFTQTYNLDPGISYIIVADGIVSASGFDPAVPFSLEAFPQAYEMGLSIENTDVLIHHGSTDAPTVDVIASGLGIPLADDLMYGGFAGYLNLPTDDYLVQVTTADGSTVVATYEAPLADLSLEGAAITVLASGFLNPAQNSDGSAFGLWVATAMGGPLVELPTVVLANDEVCQSVNIPTDGTLVTGENIIASVQDGEPVAPNGACEGTATWCDGGMGEVAVISNTIWFDFVAPASGGVLLSTCNESTNFDTQLAVWQSSDCNDFSTFSLIGANDDKAGGCDDGNQYAAELKLCGLNPGETYYVQIDGWNGSLGQMGITITELEQDACLARLQVVHNSPDAAAAVVDIRVNGGFPAADYDDLAFRHATTTIDVPAGQPLTVTVNPSTSVDDTQAILTLEDVVFQAGTSYQVVAQGIASELGYNPGPSEVPLDVVVIEGFLETNPNNNNTFIAVVHGATDAPAVSISEIEVINTTLVPSIAYGETDGYLNLPTNDYTLGVAAAGQSDLLYTFSANLEELGLNGAAITIFASGFVDPVQNSNGADFGLWASIPEGGMLIPLQDVTSVDDVDELNTLSIYPNPTAGNLTVDFDLKSGQWVNVELNSIIGQRLAQWNLGNRPSGLNREIITLPALPEGLYLLTIIVNGQQTTQKVRVSK